MSRLKGIIINGEWLGNNVIASDRFNALCTIAPNVMQEFMHLINNVKPLESKVQINNFNYGSDNVINIEFSNKELYGVMSFLFANENQKPKLVDGYIKYYGQEEPVEEAEPPIEDTEPAVDEEISVTEEKPVTEDEIADLTDNFSDDFENKLVNVEEILSDTFAEKEIPENELSEDFVGVEDIISEKFTNDSDETADEVSE